MSDFFIAVFATLGAIFVLLASIGLVRMPDTYLRISVTTKAATLGIGLILISAAFYFKEASVTTRVLASYFVYYFNGTGWRPPYRKSLLFYRCENVAQICFGRIRR